VHGSLKGESNFGIGLVVGFVYYIGTPNLGVGAKVLSEIRERSINWKEIRSRKKKYSFRSM
jgi:hypothetical protein